MVNRRKSFFFQYVYYENTTLIFAQNLRTMPASEFYSPSCLGQLTAKVSFGLRVKLPSIYHTWWRLRIIPLIAERQTVKLGIPIFIVFGLTRLGIEPVSTVSVADARSLIS